MEVRLLRVDPPADIGLPVALAGQVLDLLGVALGKRIAPNILLSNRLLGLQGLGLGSHQLDILFNRVDLDIKARESEEGKEE